MGSNMAEQHPVAFQWVVEAKERGAKVIHIDPRFTRTSALADVHVPLRPGTDIAFLGGLINHILSGERYFEPYVKTYTNACAVIGEDYRDTEDLDGLFSGWDAEGNSYDVKSGAYAESDPPKAATQKGEQSHGAHGMQLEGGRPPVWDETLENPRCVL